MGILGLNDLLRSICPHIFRKTHINSLYGKILAVDISVFLYKYVRSYGEPNWIRSLVRFLCVLKKSGIKPVIIFDGPNQPKEKEVEQRRRREESRKIKQKYDDAIDLRKYLEDLLIKGETKTPQVSQDETKNLIGRRKIDHSGKISQIVDCMDLLAGLIDRIDKQILSIGTKHQSISMEVLDALGFPYIQANGEAETLCCYLASIGEVDGVLSEDTDILAYGIKMMVSKFDGNTSEVVIVSHKEILRELALTSVEFKDLCIMLSCDYNERCKMPTKKGDKLMGVGPNRAYDLIVKHRSIDVISEETDINVVCLNHKRCRELLTVPNEYPGAVVPDCRGINHDNLEEISRKHQVSINFHEIREVYRPVTMILEEEEDSVDNKSQILTFDNSQKTCDELCHLYILWKDEDNDLDFETWVRENYPDLARTVDIFTEDAGKTIEQVSYEEAIMMVECGDFGSLNIDLFSLNEPFLQWKTENNISDSQLSYDNQSLQDDFEKWMNQNLPHIVKIIHKMQEEDESTAPRFEDPFIMYANGDLID